MWACFQRIIELLSQKFVTNLSKIWVWDPGSEIRKKNLFRNPDSSSEVKKAPDPGSATLVFNYKTSKPPPPPTPSYVWQLVLVSYFTIAQCFFFICIFCPCKSDGLCNKFLRSLDRIRPVLRLNLRPEAQTQILTYSLHSQPCPSNVETFKFINLHII
jgi:hypothetical protein